MRKRLFTGLLALALTLSLLPVSALAAETLDRFTSWHYLYEYNPQAKKYMQMSGEQATALSRARSEYGVKPYSIIGDDLPTTQKIEVPTAESYTIAIDEQYGVPVMSYTDKGGIEYTWLNIGYIIDDTLYKWTAEDLAAGGVTKDFSELAGEVLSVTYCWVPIDKLEENTESEFDTVTISFDLWSHILTSEGQGVDPPLNLPEDCDFSQEAATAALYGSNSYYGKPADISQGVKDGKVVLTDPQPVDGKLTLEWAKGYYVDLEEAFEAEFDTYRYYYVQISCGKYIWYGELTTGSWRDAPGDEESDLISSRIKADEDRTVYARFDSLFPYYVPAEGYNTTTIGYSSSVAEESEWSKTEFREVRDQITFPDWNFPSGEVAIPSENWTFKFPAPLATSTGENGEVYLDYTDGSFKWQCVGVRYRLNYDEEYTNIEWSDWGTLPEVTIPDTTGIGNNFALYYVWKEVNYDTPPRMYNVEYDFQLPEELSEVSGRRVFPVEHHDDNWGSYDAWDMFSGDSDFNENALINLQDEIKASDTTVREGTALVILANAPDNYSGYSDFRDFLAFNDNKDIYYEFGGWMDETGKVRQIGETVSVDELTADEDDDTITLKATWEPITGLSDEQYQNAANTLQLQVLGQDKDFAAPVLVTQWTDTDSNVGANNKLTGNPVILGTDNTLCYTVSATLNSGLFGSSDPNHITMGDCVALTFTLDIDPQLEFASEESMTITYNNPNLELVNTNFGTVTGPDKDGNYMVKLDPSQELPKNSDGGLHLEFDVEIINQKEPVFHKNASDPMKFTGFAFRLKDGVDTDGLVIESKGNVTGQMDLDKISNAGYHHRFRYYQVRSHLQSRDEWQELFGGATDPTAFVHAMQFIDRKLADYDLSKDKMSPIEANTVVAYGSAVIVNPADMTIYEGGDGGYDAVVDKTGQVVANGSASLPHPLFEIAAPEGVVLNGMTFTNADSSNTWTLEKLGQTDYYRFVPATGGTEVRVQYSDGSTVVTEDEFTPETDVFKQYTVSIYDGGTSGQVIAKAVDGREYLVETGTGTLTVRAVEDADPTSAVVTVESGTEYTQNVPMGSAVAVAPADTTYTLNNTGVELPADSEPSLLFDSIIEDEGTTTRTDALKDKADEKLGGADTNRRYEIKYLDLVDANNGNAWIKASGAVTIYWGYPQGTDKGTEFTVLHFKDLHRDGEESGFNVSDIAGCDVETVEGVDTTDYGISFTVEPGGFSPFALVWTVEADEPDPGDDDHQGGSVTPVKKYTIDASAGRGGEISPEGTVRVERGGDRTFRITPDEGYEVADVLVDGESVGAVTRYRFENVRENHTITVRFQLIGAEADTGVGRWLNTDDHIAYLQGYPGGLFGPEDNMTRAEVAQMFYNLLLNQNVSATVSFTDVSPDAWYADAVNALASLGMVQGVGGSQFAPERTITRAEFTVIAMRFADLPDGGENPFSDVAPTDWFYDQVVGAAQYDWITGYPDGSFGPLNTITRAEVTAIVNRMLDRQADEEYVDGHAAQLAQFTDLSPAYWAYYDIMEATNGHTYEKDRTEIWTGLF